MTCTSYSRCRKLAKGSPSYKISNVVFSLPLAVAHNGVAALLHTMGQKK